MVGHAKIKALSAKAGTVTGGKTVQVKEALCRSVSIVDIYCMKKNKIKEGYAFQLLCRMTGQWLTQLPFVFITKLLIQSFKKTCFYCKDSTDHSLKDSFNNNKLIN